MVRLEQRIAVAYIKVRVIDIVQEHIDATQVVRGDILLLTEEPFLDIVFAQNLGEFQQQRPRTACRVVDLIDIFAAVGDYARQQLRHLLRGEEFAATLAGVGGVHRHQVLVGVAEDVYLIFAVLSFEVYIAYIIQNLGQLLVALVHGAAQFIGIDIDVRKKAFEVVLALRAYGRGFYGLESIVEGYIEVRVILGVLAHIAEQLRGQYEKALFVNQLRTSSLGIRVRKLGIVKIRDPGIGLQAVDVISDVFRYKTIKEDAEDITLEVPAVDRIAQVFGCSPDGFEELLFLLYACSYVIRCCLWFLLGEDERLGWVARRLISFEFTNLHKIVVRGWCCGRKMIKFVVTEGAGVPKAPDASRAPDARGYAAVTMAVRFGNAYHSGRPA